MKKGIMFFLAVLAVIFFVDFAREMVMPVPRKNSAAFFVRDWWYYNIGPRASFDPEARAEFEREFERELARG